jgi:hypothetical protein
MLEGSGPTGQHTRGVPVFLLARDGKTKAVPCPLPPIGSHTSPEGETPSDKERAVNRSWKEVDTGSNPIVPVFPLAQGWI